MDQTLKPVFAHPGIHFLYLAEPTRWPQKDSSVPATELAQHREIHLMLKNDDFTDFEKCAK